MICSCCPRKCSVSRGEGFCRIPEGVFVSKFMLHKWEEPYLCGDAGTAAVFFSGCNLRCCFCQNNDISRSVHGSPLSINAFSDAVLSLVEKGAKSIDLVSPTPYVPFLIPYLENVKKHTRVPVIYNSGGYDLPEYLDEIAPYVDVYLPDFKYLDSDTARKFSAAPDYPQVAIKAIEKMLALSPKVILGEDGIMQKGVIIRHLVLPGHRNESAAIIDYIADNFGSALLSLMSQYTPSFNRSPYPELNRKVTSFEYNFVLNRAIERGIDGFSQQRNSADEKFTPDF